MRISDVIFSVPRGLAAVFVFALETARIVRLFVFLRTLACLTRISLWNLKYRCVYTCLCHSGRPVYVMSYFAVFVNEDRTVSEQSPLVSECRNILGSVLSFISKVLSRVYASFLSCSTISRFAREGDRGRSGDD